MNKEKVLIIFLSVSILFNIFLFTLTVTNVENTITAQAIKDLEEKEFNVYTEAVCEGNTCHDEVFVQCYDINTKLGNIIGDPTQFELDWIDPRAN
jgi:hypothetical protein